MMSQFGNINVGECNGMPQQRLKQKQYVKAIYDNIAETTDELAFKKGDILNLIEQDTDGLEGWWLCTLRGRQGICPGNRLRIINSYDSGCFSPSPVSSPSPSLGSTATLNSSTLSSEIYENSGISLKQGKRRSCNIASNKVITPKKCGDVYLYDLISPINRKSPYQNLSLMSDPETYDTPKPPTEQTNYDLPRANSRQQNKDFLRQDDSYDIPRAANLLCQQNFTPSSSNSSLLTPDNLSLSSSNRSSLANMPDYDIPRRNPQNVRSAQKSIQQNQFQTTYDIPQQYNQEKLLPLTYNKELPLQLSSALETLAKLQNETTTAITRLLSFVIPNWRTIEKLEPVLMDIKLAAVRLKTALHDLTEFGDGCLGNATKAEDKSLALKLKPLVKALRDADKLIHETSHNLEINGWTIEILARKEIKIPNTSYPPDSLDQLIACAQTLIEDIRQTTSFIQGNATLLFKRLPQLSTIDYNSVWLEDYDYVSFESRELNEKKNSDLRDIIPNNLKQNFDNTLKVAEQNAIKTNNFDINSNDKLLLKYYAVQISTHMNYLTQAIDSFLETVEKNQPPKFFIAYGKFVVLSAHNLVSIGDIVHRNLTQDDIKIRIQQFTDALSDALKQCVIKSKKAAQYFPSVTAVQDMVDSVVDISHLASDLKNSMLQLV